MAQQPGDELAAVGESIHAEWIQRKIETAAAKRRERRE
jgi:hypothetical protein